jgi:GTP-binding protein HflX
MLNTNHEIEKAILVCTTIPKSASRKSVRQKIYKEHLDELEFLTETAGAEVVGKFYQERDRIDSSYFIGRGKAEEIAASAEEKDADLVIFENPLTPTQVRNLERLINCKVLDKSGLILDIFASNARSAEAKTQVELAQLQYILPRLTRQWTHLSKQYGGIGTKGPGETQIETDRRLINNRISVLKTKLKKIEEQRKTQRQQRKNFLRVALVGYTNAGKSTLLNALTDAHAYVENKLFATLDTSTKLLKPLWRKNRKGSVETPPPVRGGREGLVLISDTVGFIRNLPHDLIESFKSTLAEVVESDLLIHVVDITQENVMEQIAVVNETLDEIHASRALGIIFAFNKIDLLSEDSRFIIGDLRARFPDAVFISAEKGINLNSLLEKIFSHLSKNREVAELRIPIGKNNAYKILNKLHQEAEVLETKYLQKSIKVKLRAYKPEIERILKEL